MTKIVCATRKCKVKAVLLLHPLVLLRYSTFILRAKPTNTGLKEKQHSLSPDRGSVLHVPRKHLRFAVGLLANSPARSQRRRRGSYSQGGSCS